MPFDGFPGFTKHDFEEDGAIDSCLAKHLVICFKRDGEYLDLYNSPQHGLIIQHHSLHDMFAVYYLDSLEYILSVIPSLLNTNWKVTDYNPELATEQFDTQLPDTVTSAAE